ncbi:uncharacterized protein ColSpa_05140 [Colletotrichum spaethianum]|uniref:Uncharacterized protein n=1 Tax=Colletotrichum spaethianum TaxID=700344 RepID=A0AA37P7P3_9PEZI|nr:uncharacterized protein ColSpa_05140 [Colletotrichum spaethianum]GKT44959.1 hypothetical protein ColSpa_05140 [Colletotrichum spaethianum]
MTPETSDRVVNSVTKNAIECSQLEHSDKSGDEVQPKEKLGQHCEISFKEIQGRFDLLRDLSDAEMDKLNKGVVRKIDLRMMPTITCMFLMRQVHNNALPSRKSYN